MNVLNPRHPIYRRILTSRLLRYPVCIFIFLTVIGMFIPDDDPDSLEAAQKLFAGTNPWRDLPQDQETVLEEIHFIKETLRDAFLPTSVPEEEDYEFLSKLVRSLETRDDISWTTMNEHEIDATVSAITNRREGGDFAPEPFGLTDRFKKLSDHWYKLKSDARKPDAWEARHDTTFLPPLLKTRGLDASEGAVVEADSGVTAMLTDEQRREMEESYLDWRTRRDRMVSYLKNHPPTPRAWFPVAKTTEGKRAAWDDVMEGRVLKAGQAVADRLLVASPKWKPWYSSLISTKIPIGWRKPGEPEMTEEESQQLLERLDRQSKRRDERREKQAAVQQRLKAEREGVKDEL
ncbi:hypothetical protein GE09DRAFT_300548 [Coniochaeta sp. 2T2.1]|nr:hypothetical protein GE09DRAFT_300548 [Coniochaeta sp. 2T2.1]